MYSSLEMQRRFAQTKVYYKVYYCVCSVWKDTTHKSWKIVTAKFFFSSVDAVGITFFDKCFFAPCDNWQTRLFIKVCRYPQVLFNRHVNAFSETSVLAEVCILFISSITVNATTKVPTWSSRKKYFLNFLSYYVHFFLHFMQWKPLCNFFSLQASEQNVFQKLKTSLEECFL